MSNGNTEQRIHAIHKTGSQQQVEEAYLDDLLNTGAVHNDQVETELPDVSSEANRAAVSCQPSPEAVSQPVETQSGNMDAVTPGNALREESVPFACQLIVLAGLRLAIPLSGFTRVLPWPDRLLSAEKPQTWRLGEMQYGDRRLDIINMAGLIFNRQQQSAPDESTEYSYTSLVLLQDGQTCLPCDEVGDMVTIDPAGVRWRSSDSERLWLAGTIRQEGYALLDLDGIMQLSGKYIRA